MSGFNTIKKSRKRSHEIEEKLNVLNRELEKMKDIQEITMNTSDLFTPVVTTLPQDPVQVPTPDPDQSSGATTDNWTQPTGDGEDGGAAGSIPSSFPRIVSNPGYQDPTLGWYSASGQPLYDESDLPYEKPDSSETGGVAALSGVQIEVGGTDPRVVSGYLRRDVAKDNFVSIEDDGAHITHNGVAITFKTHPDLFKPINYWVSFSIFNPFIDAYFPNNPQGNTPQYTGIVAGSVDSNPRALFTAYKYVGGARTQTFDPVGSRGTTTAGDSKGTGDPDQYPPLPFGDSISDEAFDAADELALGDEVDDDYFYIKDMYGTDAAEWFLNNPGKRGGNPFIPEGGYLPFAPFIHKVEAPSPFAGAADGTQVAFFGGDKDKNKTQKKATKRTNRGTADATKASTGMYPNMTPEIFFQKYGMSYNEYLLLNHFKPEGDLLRENAYMALLHRGIKPTERDYIRRGIKTPEQKKIFDERVKRVMRYARTHPKNFEFIMNRYPKSDPRLAMMNFKMDKMLSASDKYLETQFPTNQDLFTKVKDKTKKSINLTNPKNFKPVKDPIKYVDVKKTKKLKETVTRHFNKPVKSKSMFGLNMGKVRKTNQKMIEKREQEQRIKEEEKAYIQEKMSRQKSNWKDDLTDV